MGMVGSMEMPGGPKREEEEDRAERIASYLTALLATRPSNDAEYRFTDGPDLLVVTFSRKPMSSSFDFGEPTEKSRDIRDLKEWVARSLPDIAYGHAPRGLKELWTSHLPPGKPCACCRGSGRESSEDDKAEDF